MSLLKKPGKELAFSQAAVGYECDGFFVSEDAILIVSSQLLHSRGAQQAVVCELIRRRYF